MLMQICEEHAKDILGPEVKLTTLIPITINSEVLVLEATTKKKGWEVVPEKNAEVAT